MILDKYTSVQLVVGLYSQTSDLSVWMPYLTRICAQFYFVAINEYDFRPQLPFHFKYSFHK